MMISLLLVSGLLFQVNSLTVAPHSTRSRTPRTNCMHLAMSATNTDSWANLQTVASQTKVGAALDLEVESRIKGTGAPFVQNNLRLFGSNERPKLTLFRDHAGWCPYCQKTMLLIEEKQIPINIELVPMRSYGDKPQSFLNMVPSGLLPALLVETNDGRTQVITESQVIMELLDQWHSVEDGYRQMMPSDNDEEGQKRYNQLARLERELFSWWCTLIFRPEGPGGMFGKLMGGGGEPSGAMQGFLDCLAKVDNELASTSGPWFFDYTDHPTMIDFIYVSHVERMLASCAYWKGLDLRSEKYSKQFQALNAWLDSFEKRECYLAFKSDYYTHVMDIPPQYGPGYDGGFEQERLSFQKSISGKDKVSWTLPLPHDDPVQPLYRGPPLPLCVLKAADIEGDNGSVGVEGTSYLKSDKQKMSAASRQMAGWKLASNGEKVAVFAARGGPNGAKNARKGFGAELADPYANPDTELVPYVDTALKSVCRTLLSEGGPEDHAAALEAMKASLQSELPEEKARDVSSALEYLRDRVGVPRDLPLAAARQLRAHLNAAIDVLYN
ncbi:hypothetical protein ACHAWO_005589 [Cyclotella atomus]|uniref:GST N-terminal domain-containing protein n=1 Tax=Cyclotella atomus TaxID=382360 RepID=A0ABD3QS17_9STRA